MSSSGVTLDAGPLIQLDRNDRRIVVLLARANETGQQVIVPGSALAQAIRDPAKQARLTRLLRQPRTHVVPRVRRGRDAARRGVRRGHPITRPFAKPRSAGERVTATTTAIASG